MGNGKRLEYVDVARGIAMICIVLGHLGNPDINRVVFTFHLPIFFFISGYFLSERGTYGEFVRRKLRSCIVPYYFTCLCMTLIALLLAAYKQQPLGPELFRWTWASLYAAGYTGYDPFFGLSIGALWFLWATFWGTLLLRAVSGLKSVTRIVVIGSIFAVCQLTAPVLWLPLDIQAGGTAALFMYLGWLLRRVRPQLESIGNKEARAVSVVGALAIWLYAVVSFRGFYLVHDEIPNGIVDILGAICGSVLLLLISYLFTMKAGGRAHFSRGRGGTAFCSCRCT